MKSKKIEGEKISSRNDQIITYTLCLYIKLYTMWTAHDYCLLNHNKIMCSFPFNYHFYFTV